MIDTEQLKKFKKEADGTGYENEKPVNEIKEKDGSTTLWHQSGDWKYHDNYFGGEPYGGRTIISYQKKPVWIMVYYGYLDKVSNPDEAYLFLRKALRAKEEGFRGPREFGEGNYKYVNTWEGDIENYFGREDIFLNNTLIYTARYMGGLVDQREGD